MKIISICFTTTANNVFTEGFFNVCKGIEDYTSFNQTVVSSTITKEEIQLYNFKKINLFNYSKSNMLTISFIKKVIVQINKEKPDCIFFYGENPIHAIISMIVHDNIKIFSHIADPKPHSGGNIVYKLLYFISKIILIKRSKKILLASKTVRIDFIHFFKFWVNKSYLIHHSGILMLANLYSLKDDVERTRRSKNKKKYTFIFFGRIVKYKGLDRLINGFNEVSRNKDVTLMICGRGNIPKVNNTKIIIKNEFLPYTELLKYISESEAVVLPYLNASGTHTIQISNSLGVPVLATKVGCFKDYISDGINGSFISQPTKESISDALLSFISKRKKFNEKKIIKYNELHFSRSLATQEFVLEMNCM